MRKLLNFIAFQLVWLITVLTAAKGTSVYAMAAITLFAVLQLAYSHCRLADSKLIITGIVVGMLLDTVWLNLGWIDYAADLNTGLPPLWIAALWANFMLTINHSLSWLQHRRMLLVVFTLFAAPLSYYAGTKVGAVTLVEVVPAVIALALSWSLVVPIFMALATHWRQKNEETSYARL